MAKLYTVYKNGERACGIEILGAKRTVIYTINDRLERSQTIPLDRLGSLLADLLRGGFSLHLQEAFFSEKKGFQLKHPDFDSVKGAYALYCVTSDIAKVVKDIEALALPVCSQPTLRKPLMDWLRSQDMNDEFVVAPQAFPVFAIFLAEVAILNGLQLHAASVGIPAVAPSINVQAWIRWLSIGDELSAPVVAAFKVVSTGSVCSSPSQSFDMGRDLF